MTLKQRIDAFTAVGGFISRHYNGGRNSAEERLHEGFEKVVEAAGIYNNWFIPKFVNDAVFNTGAYLTPASLESFCASLKETDPKVVAVICAGNIPMVAFHDIMCVLLTGHTALIKLSSDDNVLIPFFLKLLVHYQPAIEHQIRFAEGKLEKFDAVIATGSNNTSQHFRYYFGKYPNIIRHSRTSVAILTGSESEEDLKGLGYDIFSYFGLGCRNVSKLYVPKNYVFNKFFESVIDYGFVVNNKKYGNNYDYHRAIYLLEKIPFLDNNFVMVRESPELHSPVGVIYYEQYEDTEALSGILSRNTSDIQCIVGKGHIPFGYSQRPVISDFADNIDTRHFLVNL
jgi:hypothetical protein